MATEHTAKKQRLLTEAAAKPGERTDDKEIAPPINAASVTRPRKWDRFLTAGEDRGPIQLVERFDVGLFQRIMAVHKGEIWKDTLKQANTMLRKAGTSGALSVPYEQSNYKMFDPENSFKGCYRLGRYYAMAGGSTQGLWHMIRNILACENCCITLQLNLCVGQICNNIEDIIVKRSWMVIILHVLGKNVQQNRFGASFDMFFTTKLRPVYTPLLCRTLQ